VLDPAAVRARLANVRERIARAAARAGRDPFQIRLIAVSKMFAADAVRAVAEGGDIGVARHRDAAARNAGERELQKPGDVLLQIRNEDLSRTQRHRGRAEIGEIRADRLGGERPICRFLDLDQDGALVIETGGDRRRIAAGEVFPALG